jgi:hypothetical protein
VDDYETRQATIRQAATNQQADIASKQPRLDAVLAKSQALSQQQIALVQKGEMEKATALNEQLAALQQEYQKIVDEGPAGGQTEALLEEASRDQTMYITAVVNSQAESPDQSATTLKLPSGAKSAYRWNRTEGSLVESNALVLLGPWQPMTAGRTEFVTRANARPETAQVIAVRVQADESRFETTLNAIDFNALAQLVSR